ncbi:MAG: hypothetical protein AAB562_01350 [Patescibacteria group bacterium]
MFARISGAILLVLGIVTAGMVFWAYTPADPEAIWKPLGLHYASLVFLAVWFLFSAGSMTLLVFRRGWPLLYWLGVLAFILASAAHFLTYRASGKPFMVAEADVVLPLSAATIVLWISAGFVAWLRCPEFFLPRKLR